jgi:hypothetical protein
MTMIAPCPDLTCAAPAEISHHAVANSTDGPLVLVRTHCVNGHRFLLPAQQVPSGSTAVPALGPGVLFARDSG